MEEFKGLFKSLVDIYETGYLLDNNLQLRSEFLNLFIHNNCTLVDLNVIVAALWSEYHVPHKGVIKRDANSTE